MIYHSSIALVPMIPLFSILGLLYIRLTSN